MKKLDSNISNEIIDNKLSKSDTYKLIDRLSYKKEYDIFNKNSEICKVILDMRKDCEFNDVSRLIKHEKVDIANLYFKSMLKINKAKNNKLKNETNHKNSIMCLNVHKCSCDEIENYKKTYHKKDKKLNN